MGDDTKTEEEVAVATEERSPKEETTTEAADQTIPDGPNGDPPKPTGEMPPAEEPVTKTEEDNIDGEVRKGASEENVERKTADEKPEKDGVDIKSNGNKSLEKEGELKNDKAEVTSNETEPEEKPEDPANDVAIPIVSSSKKSRPPYKYDPEKITLRFLFANRDGLTVTVECRPGDSVAEVKGALLSVWPEGKSIRSWVDCLLFES
jgi:hypothetical protein